MKILALTKYGPRGASSRVRTLQYLPFLRDAGLDVTVQPLLDDYYLERRYAGKGSSLPFILRTYTNRIAVALRARHYDLIWVEKELMPWVPGFVERGLLSGTPYVLDYDDAIFHTYDQHPNPLVRRLMGRKIDRVMRGAVLVVAGNEYLAARAQRAGAQRVVVVPSVIDLERYGPVTPLPEGPFTIGWIGSPGSERLLEHLRDVLSTATHDSETRLVLVGATDRALPGVPHETWVWSEETEVEQMRQFHVGIMPLNDSPWERGKCGYKLIQYMGVGRPVVASPIGVNAKIVDHGHSGFLALEQSEWLEAFDLLREDRDLRVQMGRAGRQMVEERYTYDVTAPVLIELLRDVVAGERQLRRPNAQ